MTDDFREVRAIHPAERGQIDKPRRSWRLGRGRRAGRDPTALRWQNDVQALRLELAERDETIARLEADLSRARAAAAAGGNAEAERLLAGLATPLTQLATQSQLGGVDGDSVLAVARSLVRAAEDEGLALIGRVGAVEPYDPARHEPLGEGEAPAPGDRVVVRFVGLRYGGDVLRTAAVETAPQA